MHLVVRARVYASYWERIFGEIASFPSGSFTFGRNIDLGSFLCAYEVESHAAQDSQIVLRMDLTYATVVAIQEPVD